LSESGIEFIMNVAILANIHKEGIRTLLPQFIDELGTAGIGVELDRGLAPILDRGYSYADVPELFQGKSMIISFGGDGTILHTARISEGYGVPILGVNLGKVGFLAEISPEEIHQIPERLKQGGYEILDRMAFVAECCGKRYFALNDIVLDRSRDTRILNLTVTVDNDYAGELTADGLIVSTPTGSTAHSMSAGGPLVMPECRVAILTAICPHSLTIRPMIIDGSRQLRIGVSEGLARMAVDGQSFVDVSAGNEVLIRTSDTPVRVARFRDKTYFDILHTRLRWGVGIKQKNE
jgi:NAD+ kinase